MIKKVIKVIISLIMLFILRYHSIYFAIDSDNSFLLNLTSKYNFMINLRPVPELPIIMAIFEHNETPLVYAIKRDKYNSVNVLLNNGADPNAVYGWKGNFGLPLEYCLRLGGPNRYKITKLLLDYGAEYYNKYSYLFELVEHDEPKSNDYKYSLFIEWLKNNDFNELKSGNKYYNTYELIRSAIFGNSYDELKYIFENYSIDVNNTYGDDEIPCIFLAVGNHRPEILKLLIEYGADIDIIYRGKTIEERAMDDELKYQEEYDRDKHEYVIVDYTDVNQEMLNILSAYRKTK